MPQYLLSVYQPDAPVPPAEVMEEIMREAALDWGRRLARATTLPIEVRPFQGGTGA